MATTLKQTGKASSIPGGMAISGAMSMVITLAISAAIANLIHTERITWNQAGYWIMGMLFTASFIGSKCAFAAIKRQRVAVSMMSGALYFGLLLCITALFFGGNFAAVLETAGIIGAGSGSAALLTWPKRNKYRKKTRNTNR